MNPHDEEEDKVPDTEPSPNLLGPDWDSFLERFRNEDVVIEENDGEYE